MANIIDIVVNASDHASSVINQVGQGFDGLASRAQKASGLINAGMLAMGTGITAVAVMGAKYNAMLESSDARWQTLTGSVEGANKQMDFISQYAKSSPFDYQGVDETATSLMGMGMELENVNSWIPTLGDFASVMGGGTETIKGVGIALGQMNAKGKVSAEEMAQLSERGFNGWQAIADGMGLSVAEVRKLSEDGKLLASDALPMLQAGMEKTFGGGTAKYMASTAGQFDQIQEAANELAGTLTKGAYDAFGAVVLPALNAGLGALNTHFSGGLLSGFQSLWQSSTQAKIGLTTLAVVITSLLIGALFLIAPAVASAVIAFAPFIAIGAAVVGVAALIMANWGVIKPFFLGIFNTIKPYFEGFKTAALNSFQMLLAGVQPIWESFKSLLVSLQPILAIVGAVIMVLLTVSMATFNGIVAAIAPVIAAFLNLVDFVTNVVMTIIHLLTGNWSGAMATWGRATQAAADFFKNIWTAIKNFFSAFVGTFISILSSFGINVVAKFNSMWASAKAAFNAGVSAILVFIAKLASQGLSKVTSMGASIVSGFSSMMSKAASMVSKGISNIIKFFENMKSKGIAIVKAVGSAITQGFTSAMSSAARAVSSGVSNIIGFFTRMGSTIRSTISAIASALVSSFTSMMSRARSAVSSGVSSIVSAIKGFASTFLSAGKGLLDSFVSGIKSGISKAKSAVSDGMAAIRDFLPFSPSKKGALRDLDKSGESFFPTWYEGALTQVRGMERAIGGAMGGLNDGLTEGYGEVGLSSFTGGRNRLTVIHEHKHEGTVKVNGNDTKAAVDFTRTSVQTKTESSFESDLRQQARSL